MSRFPTGIELAALAASALASSGILVDAADRPWIPAGMTSRTTGSGVAKCRARRKVRNRIASRSRARNRS